MQGIRAKLDYVLKHNAKFYKIFNGSISAALKILGLFVKTDEYCILFSAHNRNYNDSPRVIYEQMIKDENYSGYTFFWAIENTDYSTIPGSPIIIKPDTLKYFLTSLKCKYWVTCVNIERSLHYKKSDCVYLNTWHGTPVKTAGNSATGRQDYDFSSIDYFCVAGEYEAEIYEKDFNLNPSSIFRVGIPRNDELFSVDKDEVVLLKNKLGLPNNKKIIMYAPTWRDSDNNGKTYEIKPPISFDKWIELLGQEYIVVLRTHPYTNKLLGVEFNDFVRDFTNYPSINELIKITDILVSDYSAIIFDYCITEKPIISFAYDYSTFKKERGMHLELSEIPSGVYTTEEEVINKILTMNYNDECEKCQKFRNKYIQYGGHATEKCIEYLMKG